MMQMLKGMGAGPQQLRQLKKVGCREGEEVGRGVSMAGPARLGLAYSTAQCV